VILILLRVVPARWLLATAAACFAAVAAAAALCAALMYCQLLQVPAWVLLACLWACQQCAVLLLLCLLCQMLDAVLLSFWA
jgi:hypothetical protein